MIDPEQVPKEPSALIEGFEWVTMDLTKGSQVRQVLTAPTLMLNSP